jgi:APA family basic amino acid/polyamine antiporter
VSVPAPACAARAPSLLARKPIPPTPRTGRAHGLHRTLGAGDLVMLAIGAVIGAGIFSTLGTAAAGEVNAGGEVVRYGAGPALILSFVLLGGVCALAALCYAELASMIPQAGSAYAYSYATLGELVAWIIGWDLILEYAVGNVAVAIAWGGYFNSLVSPFFHIPTGSRTATGTRTRSPPAATPAMQALLRTAPRSPASRCSSTCRRS